MSGGFILVSRQRWWWLVFGIGSGSQHNGSLSKQQVRAIEGARSTQFSFGSTLVQHGLARVDSVSVR
ncbi:hypothetical protein HanRHA438_Chr17g0822231 [Helianthus annuus]|nr:hypothetical protein HanRHA438_Chr17g0822231 [Helianthus annuus]